MSKDNALLEDILESARAIRRYLGGTTLDKFQAFEIGDEGVEFVKSSKTRELNEGDTLIHALRV